MQFKYMWLIALKDLRIFVKDRAAVFFFIIFPFMFILMFYVLNLGAATDERLTYHLATQEAEGGISHLIIGAMETADESALPPGSPVFIWQKDYNEAYRMVEDGELSGFVAFPEDFTERIGAGLNTQLEVVADTNAIDTRVALYGIAEAIAAQVNAGQIIKNATIKLLEDNGYGQEIIGQYEQRIDTEIAAAYSNGATEQMSIIGFATEEVGDVEAGNPADYVIPGYLVMFVFFGAAVTAETIVRERQNNTLERLLASSVNKSAILGGVYTGTAFRGLIQLILFWGIGVLAFKVDLGESPLAVIILSLLMVIMSSAFALMLATLVRTQRSAGSLAVVTALILAPLGGCWWPLFILPEWLQTVAKISPHAWANTGFNKLMLFGADFGAVVPEMLALVVFTVIFGAMAVWRFRTSAV